ncbi:hypothetical protein M422DRAFT_773601 [Sphaerobolus stellatus SS14]|nr:hypothetical protein M422DRAFT_773601 [Sphaerobolus stellatus SS14]
MNSLAYLSRQFDVLASARTPPSTPTTEKHTFLPSDGSEDGVDGSPRLKRTQTWYKSMTQGQPPSKGDDGQLGKRSFSLPSLDSPKGSPWKNAQISVTTKPEIKASPIPQRIRRLYFVHAFVVLWNTLCEAWRYFIQNTFARLRQRELAVRSGEVDVLEVVSADEKESEEEEFDQIVARAPSKSTYGVEVVSEQSTSTSTIIERQEHATSSIMLESSPTEVSSLVVSTRSKSSKLLPNPFATPVLTQSSRSSSPSISLPSTPPPHPHLRKTPFHLPKTLVLDLDETLIHSTSRPMTGQGTGGTGLLGLGGRRNKGAGHMVEVILNGRSTLYHVYKRPFVDYFLRKVSGWYTLVIFTASMQEYADPVIDWLDAGRGILTRRLFRESCTQLPCGSYTKDLSLVEQDLSRVCLIDNSPISYNVNQANGIPIEGWTHDMSDEALLDLLPVLDSLRFTSDVRRVLGMRGF